VSLANSPKVQYIAYADNWKTDGVDNNGDGTVDGLDENYTYTIFSMARNGAVERRAEVVITGGDVNVWRNAIFGGAGQAGGAIAGNVSVHGSVHILGNNVLVGNPAIEALDLTGTSLIHNNYAGIPATLQGRIPAIPTRSFDGEDVSTLNAKLRVKRGFVGMSGNSEIGEANVAGNTIKETMDGTYISDGWTGNSVVNDGGRGDPKNVYSDNGWDAKYDLGDKIAFPRLSDPYHEVGTGNMYVDPATGTYYSYTSYWQKVLATTAHAGDVTIQANQNYYWNAQRPADTYAQAGNRQPTDSFILFNAGTNVLQMNGNIRITGNLTIDRGAGNDKTISYTGRAAFYVTGNVSLDTNLYSQNANGTTANSFPAANFFGLMTEGSITMGINSQLELMGGFYAQNQIKSQKQTTVTGSYVANYFDMGTNVPEIYQVPTLADNLPNGMIGGYPILIFAQVSWREVGG
jgi:hypothetical protein